MVSIKEGDASKCSCDYCHLLWTSSTSTDSIAKHLLDKHNINNTSQTQASSNVLVQTQIDASTSTSTGAISHTLKKKFDSAIVRYIISSMLPHAHIESSNFKRLMHDVLPNYQLKSTPKLKILVLQMYVVLHH